MIGTLYTLTNKRGDTITLNDHVTDPSRIIALQSYPGFDVDIKNNEVAREGQHGSWDFYSFYGRRVITFQGMLIGETEADVEAMKNLMQECLAFPIQPVEGDDGYVYLRWADLDASEWEIECKLMSSIQFSRPMGVPYRLDFTLSLKANDPFILSQEAITQVGIRAYTSTGGSFPLSLPTILGSHEVNALHVNNTGLLDAHTVIRIYGEADGDITNPVIRNLTTGKEFAITAVIDGVDEWIEIDSKEGTIVDQDGTDLSTGVAVDSEFITLRAGDNVITYRSDEDPAETLYFPSALFSVAYRSTKI